MTDRIDEALDARLQAWIDGELPAEEAAEMAALVAGDTALAKRADRLRRLSGRLRALDGVLDEPVPERLLAAARRPAAAPVDLAAFRQARMAPPRGGPPAWASMAASLIAGLTLGALLLAPAPDTPLVERDGRLVASGELDQALDRQLASADQAGLPVRIGVSYRDSDGAVCRSFATAATSGLACRERGSWRLEGLFSAAPGGDGDYRMAAGSDPRLAELIDRSIAGNAFDAEQERVAQRSGWR